MPDTANQQNKPKPPDDLDGEALLEWHRITEELQTAGKLETIDRALITLYVKAWGVWRVASRHVEEFGPVIKYSNGMPGESPFSKVATKYYGILRGYLEDMGLNPAARKPKANDDQEEFDF